MQGVINRLRPFLLGGLLLAMPLAAAQAKNVKPDPNGLAPHQVQDLAYGDVLFYFFQDDYFDSITRLLAARQLGRVPHTQEEAFLETLERRYGATLREAAHQQRDDRTFERDAEDVSREKVKGRRTRSWRRWPRDPGA